MNCADLTLQSPRQPLELVLRHLLTNAVQHHDRQRGSIVVEATLDQTDSAKVSISVKDDGPGVPEAMAEKIFNIFTQRTPNPHQGTGVGLALAQKLVDRQGGSIRVSANPDGERGALFTFTWPVKSLSPSQTGEKHP